MTELRSATVGLGVALVLAVGLADPAGAGGYLIAKSAKQQGGPYETGILDANLGPGKSKSFFVRVKNKSTEKVTLEAVQDGPDFGGYTQKYYRGADNITSEVAGGGHEFKLGAGKTKMFRIKIKRAEVSISSFCPTTDFVEIDPGNDSTSSFIGLNGSSCAG